MTLPVGPPTPEKKGCDPMSEHDNEPRSPDRRTESRETLEPFYSVELAIEGAYTRYQFKLRNISTKGLCIVVREDSAVLENLRVGNVFEVKLYQDSDPRAVRNASAQIRHVTRQTEGRYEGHCLVGLVLDASLELKGEPPSEPL